MRFSGDSFPHVYSCDVLNGTADFAGTEELYFPAQAERPAGVGIHVTVEDLEWAGFFQKGEFGLGCTVVCSCPNPNEVCVVSEGSGYIVDVTNPSDSTRLVELRPIMSVHAVPDARLLVFVGLTQVIAWDVSGKAWTTARLSYDGIEVDDVTGTVLRGRVYDASKPGMVQFQLDCATGAVSGGIESPGWGH